MKCVLFVISRMLSACVVSNFNKTKILYFLCVNYNIICIYLRISILLVYISLSIHKMSCHSMQSY